MHSFDEGHTSCEGSCSMHPPHLTANFTSSMPVPRRFSMAAPLYGDELRGKVSAVQLENQKDILWRLKALQAIPENALVKQELLEQDNATAFTMIEALIQQQGEPRSSRYPSASSLASPCLPANPRGWATQGVTFDTCGFCL